MDVSSEQLFRATDNEHLYWEVISFNGVIASDNGRLELEAGETKNLVLTQLLSLPQNEGVWLNLCIKQVEPGEWSRAGHEVARVQFELQAQAIGVWEPAAPAYIEEQPGQWRIRTADNIWIVDQHSGWLCSWVKAAWNRC